MSTPTPTGAPTLLTLTQDTQLGGYFGSNGYHRIPGGAVSFAEDYSIAAGFPVLYQAASNSFIFYQVVYAVPKASVAGPTVLVRDGAASDSSFSVYKQQAGGISYQMRQLNIGPSNPTLALQYSNLAIASVVWNDPSDGLQKVGVTPMAFGLPFDYQAVHLSGTRTYTGILVGNARGMGSHVYDLSGTIRYDIDFATTDFTAKVTLTGRDETSGQIVDLGSISWRADPPRGSPDFFYGWNANGDHLQSFLTGPNGEELVAGIDAKIPDPLSPTAQLKIAAAAVAKKQ